MATEREQAARELTAFGRAPVPVVAIGRDGDVAALVTALRTRRSVIVVGEGGSGRSAVVRAAAAGCDDPPVVELALPAMLVAGRDPGGRAGHVLALAEAAGAALHLGDVATLVAADPSHALGQLAAKLADGRVPLVVEASPTEAARLEALGTGDAVRFELPALAAEAVDRIVARAAEEVGVAIDRSTRAVLVDLSDRFLPLASQPARALELLDRVVDYVAQKAGIGEHEAVGPDFVRRVVAIYTGLPRALVEGRAPVEAEPWRVELAARVVGQEAAVARVAGLLADEVAAERAGDRRPGPRASVVLAGPSGVGRTTLARSIADLRFGSPGRVSRVDASALAGPDGAHLAAVLARQPFQVVLVDHADALDDAAPDDAAARAVLAALLSDGLAEVQGLTLDARRAWIVVETTVVDGDAPSADVVERARALHAGWIRAADAVVPFQGLDAAASRRIAARLVEALSAREGLTARRVVVEADDEALDLLVRAGVDPRWGARGLEREVLRRIVAPVHDALGDTGVVGPLTVTATGRDGRVALHGLPRVSRPAGPRVVEARGGIQAGLADLESVVVSARGDLEVVALAVDEGGLRQRVERAEARRRPADSADEAREVLDRLARLRSQAGEVTLRLDQAQASSLRVTPRSDDLAALEADVEALRHAIDEARHELLLYPHDGLRDALVEVRPVGGGRDGAATRDALVRAYVAAAEASRRKVVWLRDPLTDDEPAHLAIRGRGSAGLWRLEAGLHRIRVEEGVGVVRVRVAPWAARPSPVVLGEHRALKASGRFGGKVRSRLVCAHDLVLQNGRTLAENRDLAYEVAAAWAAVPPASDVVTRRWELATGEVLDTLLGDLVVDPRRPVEWLAILYARVEAAARGPSVA